jgi:hypothetical protein
VERGVKENVRGVREKTEVARQLIKLYSSSNITGPDSFAATSRVTGTIPSVRCGRREPRLVSTSHVGMTQLECQDSPLPLRPQGERARRNHKASVALWVAWYNFVGVSTAVRMTACMAAGITSRIWT